jgi:tetratricopeptide (TPR) repeat protein
MGIMRKLKWLKQSSNTVKCFNSGKYDEALKSAEYALSLSKEEFGEYHANVVKSLYNLCHLHKTKEEYTIAEKYCLKALSIHENNYGLEDDELVEDLDNLALIYTKMDRLDEVKKIDERISNIKSKNS